MKMSSITKNEKINKYISLICLFLFIIFILTPFNVYGAEDDEDLKENEEIKNPFYDYRNDKNQQISNPGGSKNTSETQNKVVSDNKESVEEETKEKKEKSYTAPESKVIKIKDKRIKPSFYWQGLIFANNQYKILLEYNNKTHIMGIGDKLNGYQIINIDSKKITLSKKNYIYYLNMGRE